MKSNSIEKWIISVLVLLLILSMHVYIANNRHSKLITDLMKRAKAAAPITSFLDAEGQLLGINSFKWGDVIDSETSFTIEEPTFRDGFLIITEDQHWLWDRGFGAIDVALLVNENKLVGLSFTGSYQTEYPKEFYTEIVGRESDKVINGRMTWLIGDVIVSIENRGLRILHRGAENIEVTKLFLFSRLE